MWMPDNELDKDLNATDLTWSEAAEMVEDCTEWHSHTVQCAGTA